MVRHVFAALVLVMAAAMLAACGRPIVVHTLAASSGAPVDDVRIYRYHFSIFSIWPSTRSVQTGVNGDAIVTVGPSATNLTLLRQGYEPVLMAVFEQSSQSLVPDKGGYDYILRYDTLEERQRVPVELRPVRREPVDLLVTDQATGLPLPDASVYAATFLYLPQPGVEKNWGFPPVQQVVTDAEGRAQVEQVSGFINRIQVRKKGYQNTVVSLDGRTMEGPVARQVQLRPLQVKAVTFLVVDAKTRKPLQGAELSFGQISDGLPPSPDAWAATTDSKGLTPPLPVSDLEPFVLSVRAKGYKEWRGAPLWRTLDDQMVRRIEMRRE